MFVGIHLGKRSVMVVRVVRLAVLALYDPPATTAFGSWRVNCVLPVVAISSLRKAALPVPENRAVLCVFASPIGDAIEGVVDLTQAIGVLEREQPTSRRSCLANCVNPHPGELARAKNGADDCSRNPDSADVLPSEQVLPDDSPRNVDSITNDRNESDADGDCGWARPACDELRAQPKRIAEADRVGAGVAIEVDAPRQPDGILGEQGPSHWISPTWREFRPRSPSRSRAPARNGRPG